MVMWGGLSLEQLFLEVGWLQLKSLIELLFSSIWTSSLWLRSLQMALWPLSLVTAPATLSLFKFPFYLIEKYSIYMMRR